jgi:tetratricopeptide (TPR) repeat protein
MRDPKECPVPVSPPSDSWDALRIVNLAGNPGFELTSLSADQRNDFDFPLDKGGLYTHVHNTARASDKWRASGTHSVVVHGTSQSNDTFICPGGRNQTQTFRLGMRPGETYTAQVKVHLEAPLVGPLKGSPLAIVFGCIIGDKTHWSHAVSDRAPNQRCTRQLRLTFTVPENATAAWIKLACGMSEGHGAVYWDEFILTRTDEPIKFFDGETSVDEHYTYGWEGERFLSPSYRQLRSPDELLNDPVTGDLLPEAELIAMTRRLAAVGTPDEVTAVTGLLESIPGVSPSTLEVLTQVDLAKRKQAETARRLRSAVADAEATPGHHVQRARALQDKRQWRSAVAAWQKAVALDPDNASLRYELGAAHDRLRDSESSGPVYRQAVALDDPLPFDAEAVMSSSPEAFHAKRDMGIFISDHLDEIRRRADLDPGGSLAVPGAPLTVFSYWAQGYDQAPALVQRCLDRTRHASGGRAQILTDDDLPFFVDLPRRIVTGLTHDKTHFSDVLRLELLHQYGGAWLDATCWMTAPVDEFLDEYLTADFTAPLIDQGRISNWFLAARPGSRIITLLRQAMHMWWEENPYVPHYFYMHHMFEMLYWLDDEFRTEWQGSSAPSSEAAHQFQARLSDPYASVDVNGILDACPLQKLTYKYKQASVNPTTFLAEFIRGNPGLIGSR